MKKQDADKLKTLDLKHGRKFSIPPVEAQQMTTRPSHERDGLSSKKLGKRTIH
jgi:hypothetical protein